MTDLEKTIEKIQKAVASRARFDIPENLIVNPSPIEYEMAILDGIEDINNFKPLTSYSLENLIAKGSRWMRIVYLASEVNIYRILVKDWVAQGLDANIEELSLASRLPDYNSILSELEAKLEESVSRIKQGPVTRQSSFSTLPTTSASLSSSAYLQALKNQLDKNNTVY